MSTETTTYEQVEKIMRDYQRDHSPGSECGCWQAYWGWRPEDYEEIQDDVIPEDVAIDLMTRLALLFDPDRQSGAWDPEPYSWDGRALIEQLRDIGVLLEPVCTERLKP